MDRIRKPRSFLSSDCMYDKCDDLLSTNRHSEDELAEYTQRCPIRLFDLHEMKLVTRVGLANHISAELEDRNIQLSWQWDECIDRVFKYAILSHRWLQEEVDIADLARFAEGGDIEGKAESKKKLDGFFSAPRAAGYRFVWFDTGCIDQRIGPEVDESIRAMFTWYRNAHACFVYLGDTTTLADVRDDGWFKRGWTLQELLAPTRLLFFNKDWHRVSALGGKFDFDRGLPVWIDGRLHRELLSGSGILYIGGYATTPSADHASRMFEYLRNRRTTRPEDMAYCLISLLNVHMPIAYGEGAGRAFYRLQLACLQDSAERSIFNWDNRNHLPSHWNSMLASSPQAFNGQREDLVFPTIRFNIFDASSQVDVSFTVNNGGIRIMMCLFDLGSPSIAKTMTFDRDDGTEWAYIPCHFKCFGQTLGTITLFAHPFHVSADSCKQLTVSIYGWSGQTSYGVLLEQGNDTSRAGYKRCSWGEVVKLPTADEILKSGIKPQWVYIK
ncbi:hypothetical protein ONZ45_g5749 [Pleurotus djamor]|nr:hypothetical protein ONZ45_g5749 [Pleurotus djamor]